MNTKTLVLATFAIFGLSQSVIAKTNPIILSEEAGRCYYIAQESILNFEVDIMLSDEWTVEKIEAIRDSAAETNKELIKSTTEGLDKNTAKKVKDRLTQAFNKQKWFAYGYVGAVGGLHGIDSSLKRCIAANK